jgi:hypothetical protein
MLLMSTGRGGRIQSEPRAIMNRNATNNRTPLAAIGPQAYELTDAELDGISGGDTNTTKQTTAHKTEDYLFLSMQNTLIANY